MDIVFKQIDTVDEVSIEKEVRFEDIEVGCEDAYDTIERVVSTWASANEK